LPNFASSLFNTITLETSNSFEYLSELSSSPGEPIAASSPAHTGMGHRQQANRQAKKDSNLRSHIRVVIVNFQSALSKKEETLEMIDSVNPDIIMGTETWLDKSVGDSEVLPEVYKLYRHDIDRHKHGVYLAIKSDLVSSEVMCVCTVFFKGCSCLLLCVMQQYWQ
jgi:hypothetical protein